MCIRDRSCASCWVRARRGSGETASPSWFCSFISCLHAERIPIGSAEANLDVLREILRKTTKPNTPLAVPKISYLHHGLLAVAPRFLATQRDHKLRQHNLSVVSARDELRQTIAILGWQEHRWQKERLCNFGHLHHGGLQSGRVTCAMGISRQLQQKVST